MNTLAVICARRTESWNKNIAELCGNPLIWYSIKATEKSKYINRAVISTNDVNIAEIAEKCGGDVPFIRPSHLALPASRIEASLLHALDYCEKQDGKRYECIVLLQNSSPLRISSDIDCCIQKIISGADSAFTIHEVIENHPDLCCYIENKRVSLFRECAPFRRQDREKTYAINGLVFAIRRDLLIATERVIHDKSSYCIVPSYRAIDIHTELDLKIAETIMQYMEKNQCQECC